jgi:serine acetyltransferase
MTPAPNRAVVALREDVRLAGRLCDPRALSRATWLLSSRGLFALAVHRLDHALGDHGGRSPASRALLGAALAAARYASAVRAKCQIRRDSTIDAGVYLSPRGHIVVGAKWIGAGTVIHDRVTIGARATDRGTPTIQRRVWIGPESVIYGNICVGEGATILPRTVLSRSIPAGAVVEGNPARIVRRDFDNSALLRSPEPRPSILAFLARPGA